MDYQKIIDDIGAMACVVSVELKENGSYGDVRIVAGNQAYIDSIEHPLKETGLQQTKFVPNELYTNYTPRDMSFEQFCFMTVKGNKCLHSYAKPESFGQWFNMTYIPLESDDPNLGYCMFLMEMNPEVDSSKATAVSVNLARTILEICIKIRQTLDFRASMNEVIGDIRDLCEARRCCIILLDSPTRTFDVLCEAQRDDLDLPPISKVVTPEFYDLLETWEDTLAGANGLIICNDQEMETIKDRNPKWYHSLKRGGVESLIAFPVKSQNEILGYIWATNFQVEKAQDIKETLELVTFVLGSEIANYQLLERLRILSAKDLLTGVQNRNLMNHYVEQLALGKAECGKTVGVVFADVNDLKTVNDYKGHDAGDDLLRSAADALKNVFPETSIFRAGGDEFTIILTGTTQEEIEALVERTRVVSSRDANVSFAIGSAVESDACNVRAALRKADEKMYEDKKHFYELHPEKRRTPGLG